MKDHLDVRGHDNVLTYLFDFVKGREVLTEKDIRAMHTVLLHEPYEVESQTEDGRIVKKMVKLGEYKTEPNCIRSKSGAPKYFLRPEDVPPAMKKLVDDLRGWL